MASELSWKRSFYFVSQNNIWIYIGSAVISLRTLMKCNKGSTKRDKLLCAIIFITETANRKRKRGLEVEKGELRIDLGIYHGV